MPVLSEQDSCIDLLAWSKGYYYIITMRETPYILESSSLADESLWTPSLLICGIRMSGSSLALWPRWRKNPGPKNTFPGLDYCWIWQCEKKAALCTCVLDMGSDFLYSCGSEMAETMKAPICTANGTVCTFPVQAEPRSQLYKQHRPLMAVELKQHWPR